METLKLYKERAVEIRKGYKPEQSAYKEQTRRIELVDKAINKKK